MKRKLAIPAVILLAALPVAWMALGPRTTPPGQLPLGMLEPGNFPLLIQAFNAASDQTRVLVMLSPT